MPNAASDSSKGPLDLDLSKLSFELDPVILEGFESYNSRRFQIEPLGGWVAPPLTESLADVYVAFYKDGLKEGCSAPDNILESILSVHAFQVACENKTLSSDAYLPDFSRVDVFSAFPVSNALTRYLDHTENVDPYFLNKLLDCGVQDVDVYLYALTKGVEPNRLTLRKAVMANMTALIAPMLEKLKALEVKIECPLVLPYTRIMGRLDIGVGQNSGSIDPHTVLALFEYGFKPKANAIDFLLSYGRNYPEDKKAAVIEMLYTRYHVQPTDFTFSLILNNYACDEIVALLERMPVPIPQGAWHVYLSKFQGVFHDAFGPKFLELPHFLLRQTNLMIPENVAYRLKNVRTLALIGRRVFSDDIVYKVERYRTHQQRLGLILLLHKKGFLAPHAQSILDFICDSPEQIPLQQSLCQGVFDSIRRHREMDPKSQSDDAVAGATLDGASLPHPF